MVTARIEFKNEEAKTHAKDLWHYLHGMHFGHTCRTRHAWVFLDLASEYFEADTWLHHVFIQVINI